MKQKKKVIDKRCLIALSVAMAFTAGVGVADAATKDVQLVKDWNLVNTPLQPTNTAVDSVLGSVSGKYVSAWAWDATAMKWKVRLASESGAAIGDYATSKNFAKLQTIEAGQGFWLNMTAAGTLTITGAAPVNTNNALVAGWNLVGSKFDGVKSVADVVAAQGAVGVKPVSLWKWQGANWGVALPYSSDGIAIADGGAAYAQSKGFATLAALAATDGYWVNATAGGNPTDTPPQVGKVYKTTGANTYVPLANAPVYKNVVDETHKIGTTDSNGNFTLPTGLLATDVIIVGSGSEYTVSASALTGGELYMFAQDQDKNKVSLTVEEAGAQKPTPKKICSADGLACITVSNMQLTKDITVAVSPYKSPLSIPNLAQIKSMTCNDDNDPLTAETPCNYKAVAGADVIFTDSMGDNMNETAAGFKGTVKGVAGNFITELAGSNLEGYLTNGIGSADIMQYIDGSWIKAGTATLTGEVTKIKNPNDDPGVQGDETIDGPKVYTFKGTAIADRLKPFIFAFKTDFLKGSVAVTVTNKGLLYKSSVTGDTIVTSNTEAQGAVLDESYGSPVAGALVTTDNPDSFGTTDSNGTVTLDYILPPSNPNLSLIIKKDGYFDATSSFNAIDDKTKAVDILEVPATAAVGGVIKDKATKIGIAEANVTLKNPIVLDKIVDGLLDDDGDIDTPGVPAIMVGLDAEATYLWEIKRKGTEAWLTVLDGVAKNTLTKKTIKATLVTNFDAFVASLSEAEKAALGKNPAGTYDVKITVTHPFSNLSYVESAIGYLDVTFDMDKFEQTGSISSALLGQISIYGGNDIGFYYTTVPNLPKDYLQNYTWTTSIVVNDSADNMVKNISGDESTNAFYLFTDALNLLQKNYLELISDCGFTLAEDQGQTCLESGLSIWVQMTGNYEFGMDGVGAGKQLITKTIQAEFDVPGMADPLAPLVVGKLEVLPNTTMAFEEQQTTDSNGSYLFAFVDPQLNGMLGLYAAAMDYFPNNLFMDKDAYPLLQGWITPADLELTKVPTEDQPPLIQLPPTPGLTDPLPEDETNTPVAVTGWLETFEDCNALTAWTSSNPTDPVKWQCLQNPELVGPALGGVQYPLLDSDGDGVADTGAAAMLLPAYEGTGVAWFGKLTNAIINNQDSNYSSGAMNGTLTSPEIDLNGYSFATLDLASWFEVESVDVAKWQFDQMKIEVAVVSDTYPVTVGDYTFNGADEYKIVAFMNPDSEAAVQQTEINFSSGGNDAVPVWIKKQANLNPFANQTITVNEQPQKNATQKIKVRFNFNTQDSLFNGWRGWGVDNVAIVNADSGLPFNLEQSGYWWKAPARKP